MKFKIFGLFLLCVAFAVPLLARAQEQISSFGANITINKDASVRVVETITYDFGDTPHHGIYRDIPFHYSTTVQNYNVRLSGISVTDGQGRAYKFSVSTKGDDKEIKIGDPNATVTGVHTYVIGYTASRAISYFDDHDEFYWNVTGNGWQVPIVQSSAAVTLPSAIKLADLNGHCFAGAYGSALPCDAAEADRQDMVDQARFMQNRTLQPAEGLTIALSFPKGLVAKPTLWQEILYTLRDNLVLGLPLLVLLFLLYWWNRRGRDPQGYKTVVAQYEPPQDLTPSEVGTIVDESADNQDISADIINLAVKGYLKITRTQKKVVFFDVTDYQLDKLKEPADLQNGFERRLMEGLFEGAEKTVMLSDLKNKFYRDLKDVKKMIYASAVDKGYFKQNPQTVRGIYIAIGAVFIFAGFVLSGNLGLLYLLSFAASGAIVVIFSFLMPARTAKGAEARQHILGLKLYLSVAEKDRLAFHNAPEKTPERFEKLLPYAIALKVDQQWARQFEGIYRAQPSWYYDASGHPFTSYILVSNLHSFINTSNTVMASAPRGAAGGGSAFGGGGFSGGGFGGGGGGSW